MRPRARTFGLVAAAVVVQLAVLALAHDLVYLARYGSRYGEALVHAGHGEGWRTAVLTSIALGGVVAAVAVARLVWLHVQLRRTRAAPSAGGLDGRALLRTWLLAGPTLAITTAALLTAQENLERSAMRGPSAGIVILLSPEYAGGLWIALAVGLVVGFVVALVAWRIRVLSERLEAARHRRRYVRVGSVNRPRWLVDRPATSILGRRSALRAPPATMPAS